MKTFLLKNTIKTTKKEKFYEGRNLEDVSTYVQDHREFDTFRAPSYSSKSKFRSKSEMTKSRLQKARTKKSTHSNSSIEYEKINQFTLSKIIRSMKKRHEKDEVLNSINPVETNVSKSGSRNSLQRSKSKKKVTFNSDRQNTEALLKKYFKPSKRDKKNNSFTLSLHEASNTSATRLPEIKLNRLGFESQTAKLERVKRKRRVKKFYSKLSSIILKDIPKEKIYSKLKKQDSLLLKAKKERKVNSVDIFWLRKENQKLKELGYEIENLDYYLKDDRSRKTGMSNVKSRKARGYYGLRSFSLLK